MNKIFFQKTLVLKLVKKRYISSSFKDNKIDTWEWSIAEDTYGYGRFGATTIRSRFASISSIHFNLGIKIKAIHPKGSTPTSATTRPSTASQCGNLFSSLFGELYLASRGCCCRGSRRCCRLLFTSTWSTSRAPPWPHATDTTLKFLHKKLPEQMRWFLH